MGNGDVRSFEDALRMIKETNCDGVMIGRASEGNPWIFREVKAAFSGEPVPERPDMEEIKGTILRHAKMLCDLKGEHVAMLEMRKHAAWYIRGAENAAGLRKKLSALKTMEDLEHALKEIR